jgi:hypothetical protein
MAGFARWSTLAALAAVAALAPLAGVGCGGNAPSVDAGPDFDLVPPPDWRRASATPPLAAAWETEMFRNGFTPTLNVMIQPRPKGTADEAYAAWRDGLLRGLAKQYQEVEVLKERPFEAGGRSGRLIIILCHLPIPGGGMPMPLFAYGAVFDARGRFYTVGALTGAELDAQTRQVTPIGEPALLASLASFRLH